MFAKLIGQSNSTHSLDSALERTLRALDEFQIQGLPTNLRQLRAILAQRDVRAGDARTTLLAENPELTSPAGAAPAASGALALFEQQAAALGGGRIAPALSLIHI